MIVEFVVIIAIVSLIFSIVLFIDMVKRVWSGFFALLLAIVSVFLFTWIIKSAGQPLVENFYYCEIKTITFPDNTSKQLFTTPDGVHHNVHELWQQLIDEKEYQVECVVPEKKYFGLVYGLKTRYNLVKKQKK